jgi:TfoX/Sxy family transcriptional regulator of competence genes
VAYDEELADRVREQVLGEVGLSEKRMFGGLGFMIDGNLAVSASSQGGLLLRVDPAETDDLVADPQADRFVMRGREMNGWLHIHVDATASDEELERWVDRGIAYARSLPPKH